MRKRFKPVAYARTLVLGLLVTSPLAAWTAEVEPAGRAIGAVTFDATIELDPPHSGRHVLLFARCWVGLDYYRVGVVWAEPHARGLDFPIYPLTLSMGSDAQAFTVTHDLVAGTDHTFRAPW